MIREIIKLTRYDENVLFVLVSTLIGARFSGPAPLSRIALVFLANWLAVAFAFMVNDIEDASCDALNPSKADRNPISAGRLPRRTAWIAALVFALLSLAAFGCLGTVPLQLGVCTLALGILYSWRAVRLKCIPFVDLIAHGMLLAALQILTAYFGLSPESGRGWVAPTVFVTFVSFYGELYNEARDLEWDLRAGLTHTVALIGPRAARWLMAAFITVSTGTAVYAVVVRLVPWWVAPLAAGWGVALIAARALLLARRPTARVLNLNDTIMTSGALTLVCWWLMERAGR